MVNWHLPKLMNVAIEYSLKRYTNQVITVCLLKALVSLFTAKVFGFATARAIMARIARYSMPLNAM